jgi:hypothetical protein
MTASGSAERITTGTSSERNRMTIIIIRKATLKRVKPGQH